MKRKGVILILVLSVLMLIALFLAAGEQPKPELALEIPSGESTQIIRGTQIQDELIFFLPSHAGLNEARLRLNTTSAVYIDHVSVADGMPCDSFQLDTPYDFSYSYLGGKHSGKLRFVSSAGVASLYIDTQSGAMGHIHASKGNEEPGAMRLITADGTLGHSGELKYIRGRGNSTWDLHEKKPYNIRLTAGADLLGMGSAEKWVLLANGEDPTHLRNKIVYDFAAELGMPYTPESRWVDLYLNGEYAGLYLLCERNEVQENRVNLSGEGSFLVSQEMGARLIDQGIPNVTTAANQSLRVHYPKDAGALQEIQDCWQRIENAVLADDGRDPESGMHWMDLIDLDSWARKYLIEELFGNIDGCAVSQFFYRDGSDPSGKVYAGPVWDYDYSMGSDANWQLTTPRAFYANRLYVRFSSETPWFHALYRKAEFYNRVLEIYRDAYLPLLNRLVEESIPEYSEQIRIAAANNRLRWNLEADSAEEAQQIARFLQERAEFLSSAWLEGEQWVQLSADPGMDGCYAYYALRPGETLDSLPVPPELDNQSFTGWYYADSNEPFDITRPIEEDTHIYAGWQGVSQIGVNRVLKLIPLGIIATLCLFMIFIEFRRNRQGR